VETEVEGDKSAGVIARRFRGFYPVVVDVETGGFNAATDALLEIAAVTLAGLQAQNGKWVILNQVDGTLTKVAVSIA